MISSRLRPRLVGFGLLCAMSPRWSAGNQSTPEASPPAATPAGRDGGLPRLVDGRYQLPDDPTATVIDLTFGNPTLPPEYQYGYEVTIDASGHAVATISPVGSRASTPTVDASEQSAELGEDGLQDLLAELEALGFFELPPEDPENLLIGGEVDAIEVTLADGQWRVNSWSLEGSDLEEKFAAAHEAILGAVGIDGAPDLGR